jgi:hypothetical protein
MNGAPPTSLRAGDYVMNFPVERPGDRDTARDAMKRNGCRSIRFEAREVEIDGPDGRPVSAVSVIAHGYVGRMAGNEVESL